MTDKECFNGLVLIARFELDPFAKEIYVTRNSKGQLLTMVAVDGWIKILDHTPHYDGFDVEIKEEFRGKGYGKQIMSLIEEKARELGLKKMGLLVFGYNEAARKLYESVG